MANTDMYELVDRLAAKAAARRARRNTQAFYDAYFDTRARLCDHAARHHLTKLESREAARVLRERGYQVTGNDCYEYGANVISRVAGADPDARREVRAILEEIAS